VNICDVIDVDNEEQVPSTEPCGTPDDTGKVFESDPFTKTY